MNSKQKFVIALCGVFIAFILLQVAFFLGRTEVRRDKQSLLNQYYLLLKKDPVAAKRALQLIIQQNPDDQEAIRELAYWYLRQGDIHSAVAQFERANTNDRTDMQSAFELGKLYLLIGQRAKATVLLKEVQQSDNANLVERATKLLGPIQVASPSTIMPEEAVPAISMPTAVLATANSTLITPSASSITSTTNTAAAASTISERDKLMNDFYETKKTNPTLAYEKIKHIIKLYPNDVDALKEAGYYSLMTLKDNARAQYYFCRVYKLTDDPKIALQLAYILGDSHQPRESYHYFDLATHTTDLSDRMTAELAKTSLRGVQTKFLPEPYYASLDFSPLYMSRFQLMIYPLIAHVGRVMNETYHWKIYLSYRRISDNQSTSGSMNQLPSIYQDSTAITAIGSSFIPFPKALPGLIVFAEIGKAKDLIYQNRSRWRNDFRGGLAYYNEWGRQPEYTFKKQFMFHFNGDVYSDAIYYNRYHDGIFTFRARPGFRIFRYGSTSLNLYYRLFLIEDQARQFYNNLYENGPGIALTPSDRYNITFRYESTRGHYLPASSPSVNPYKQTYHNNIYEMDTYFEF